MRGLSLALVLAVWAALGVGCEALDQATCDTTAAPGLVITVSQGDGGPASCTATVTITAEDGTETTLTEKDSVGNPCVYNGAYNRPGTYKITAKQSGWQPATKIGVLVEPGTCHVHTVAVTMVLMN